MGERLPRTTIYLTAALLFNGEGTSQQELALYISGCRCGMVAFNPDIAPATIPSATILVIWPGLSMVLFLVPAGLKNVPSQSLCSAACRRPLLVSSFGILLTIGARQFVVAVPLT